MKKEKEIVAKVEIDGKVKFFSLVEEGATFKGLKRRILEKHPSAKNIERYNYTKIKEHYGMHV